MKIEEKKRWENIFTQKHDYIANIWQRDTMTHGQEEVSCTRVGGNYCLVKGDCLLLLGTLWRLYVDRKKKY